MRTGRSCQNRLIESGQTVGRENGAKAFPLHQQTDRVAKAVVVVNYQNSLHGKAI
jgi:hypothetical protein